MMPVWFSNIYLNLQFRITRAFLPLPTLTFAPRFILSSTGKRSWGKHLALVSNFRLLHMEDGVPAPEGIYYERLVKVALHEIGHTLSLYHCETPKCLMQVSRGLRHLDDLDIIFCDRCSFLLSETMKHF